MIAVVEDQRSTQELVRRCYALGEIDRQRFVELLADLGAGGGAAMPVESRADTTVEARAGTGRTVPPKVGTVLDLAPAWRAGSAGRRA